MARTLEIVDESEHQVITLDWDDLHTPPNIDEGTPYGARTRKMSAADGAIDFLAELRRLNDTFEMM